MWMWCKADVGKPRDSSSLPGWKLRRRLGVTFHIYIETEKALTQRLAATESGGTQGPWPAQGYFVPLWWAFYNRCFSYCATWSVLPRWVKSHMLNAGCSREFHVWSSFFKVPIDNKGLPTMSPPLISLPRGKHGDGTFLAERYLWGPCRQWEAIYPRGGANKRCSFVTWTSEVVWSRDSGSGKGLWV